MINKNKYKFNLLKDEIESEDYFEDKTHQRIADTLYKLIANEKNNGITIGLEGVWGSGKSTVVSLLNKKLKNRNYLYFYFDAWAHEGDPLRRIFLESLINKLGSKDEKLNELNKRISHRKKIVNINSKRTPTLLGILLSITALLVPLGVALISIIDITTLTLKMTGKINFIFLIGLFLSLAPFLVIFCNCIFLKLQRKKILKSNNWRFISVDSEYETTQEISENDERTSIEFERYFKEILNIILNKTKTEKKLIIVIDNLDRIDPNDSLKIWSTLQTFLHQPTYGVYNKIWIIVPYDPEGLKKIWEQKENNDVCTKSFFEKCFQLRLEVPKPVLSSWEQFTRKKIEEAIPVWPTKDKEDILDIIKMTRLKLTDIPTPRQIKTYINQICLLRLHADQSIPTQSIAYYVITKYINNHYTAEEFREQLVEKKIPMEKDIPLLQSECTSHLAGLSFGTDPDKGQQLLLEPEIEKALNNTDGKKLNVLLKKHQNAFWMILSYHIQKVSENEKLLIYSETIYNTLWKKYKNKRKNILSLLKNTKLEFPTESTISNYIAFITLLCESNVDLQPYWFQIMKGLCFELNNDENKSIEALINIFINILNSFKSYKLQKVSCEVKNIKNWENWATKTLEKRVEAYNWISPESTIINLLPENIKPGVAIPIEKLKLHRYSLKAGVLGWEEFVQACNKHIAFNEGTVVDGKHTFEILEILVDLCFTDKSVTDTIRRITKNSEFHNFVYHYKGFGSALYSALIMAYFYKREIFEFKLPQKGESKQGIVIIRSFWKNRNSENAQKLWFYICKYKLYNMIWEMLKGESELVVDIIIIAIKQNNNNFFVMEEVFDKLKILNKLLKEDEKEKFENEILISLIDNSSLIEEIKKNNIEVTEDCEYLCKIIKTDKADVIIDLLSEKLSNITIEEWHTAFENDTYLTSLAIIINEKQTNFNLRNEYFEALYTFSSNWITGNIDPSEWQQDTWDNLINILGKNFKTHYKKKITELLWKNLININIDWFNVHIKYFNIKTTIQANSEVLQKLLEESIKDGINYNKLEILDIILQGDKNNKFSPENHFPDLMDEPLKEIYNNSKKERKELIKRVAKAFNVIIE